MNAPKDQKDGKDQRQEPGFIPPHGGYQKLLSYQKAEIAFDATAYFCRRFLDRRDRTYDQMVQAARLSERLGLAPAADTARLRTLLQRFGLPVSPPPGLDADTLLAHMRLDKKAQSGGLRFIVWDGAGRARVLAGVPEAAVRAVLAGD